MTERHDAAPVRYAELHAHSAFSFLDGANNPAELVAEASRLDLSAIALTDHNGFYGVVQFSQAARQVGIPTVFGAELSLDQRGPLTGIPDPQATHLLVLATGTAGYHSLSRAIAEAHLATGKKGLSAYRLEDLGARSRGDWLVLSGCRKGAVRRALMTEGLDGARRELELLIGLFGRDHVVVELTDHGDPHDSEHNDALWHLAQACGLPAVATGNVHYARPSDYPLATAMSALRARRSLEDMDGWLPASPAGFLRSGAEMDRLFARYPGVVTRAADLGEALSFDLKLVAPDLPPCDVPAGHTEATWLRELTMRGAHEYYGSRAAADKAKAYAQIEHELRVIEDLKFP